MLIHFSHVQPKWTVAQQIPLSMEFSRQEYWNGLPCSSPRDLPDPGIKPVSLTSPALAGGFFTTSPTGEAHYSAYPIYSFFTKSILHTVLEIAARRRGPIEHLQYAKYRA